MEASPVIETAAAAFPEFPTQSFAEVNDGKAGVGMAQVHPVTLQLGTSPELEHTKLLNLPVESFTTMPEVTPKEPVKSKSAPTIVPSKILLEVMAPTPTVTTPALSIVASPLMETAVAALPELPTQIFAEFKELLILVLKAS